MFGGLSFTGYEYWLANRDYEDTDDAFIDGNAVTISPQVSGNVVSLDITDNQFVKAGQPLIHIDNRQYVIDVENAKANLATAEGQYAGFQYAAEVAKKNFPAQLDAAKAQLAVRPGAARAGLRRTMSARSRCPRARRRRQEVDAATAAFQQAQAQVAQAQAQVEQDEPVPQRIGQAEAQVVAIPRRNRAGESQARPGVCSISRGQSSQAPQDGWITKRNVKVGTYVTPGQQIFSLVSPQVWVTANLQGKPARRICARASL